MPPIDGELDIPVPGDGSPRIGQPTEPDKERKMDAAISDLLTHQLAQTGNIAQNNFVTTQKALDFDFIEGKRMVTLDEAVGVREVASKSVPAGPTSA